MDSKTVILAGVKTGKIAVPAERRHLGKFPPGLISLVVEETKLHALCDAGENGEIYARSVIVGAKRPWLAGLQ
jgi:hypothetical protein